MASMSESVMTTAPATSRSEEHTSELQSLRHLVCRLLLEKKKKKKKKQKTKKKKLMNTKTKHTRNTRQKQKKNNKEINESQRRKATQYDTVIDSILISSR